MINMIDVREVRGELEALASRLSKTDEKAAQRLRNLNSAVGGGSNADVWAAVDIRQLIEPEQIINRYKNRRVTNMAVILLEGLRNLLIFAPLVVTWFGISNAVNAYSDLVGSKAGGSEIQLPFIYLWQRGFDGHLAGWETLGYLAGIDFLILLTVLILTFALFFTNDLLRTRQESEAEDLREDLTHTLARASLCLVKSNRQQPGTAIANFGDSITRFDTVIRQLLAQMKDIADRQGNERQFFDNFTRALETVMRNISGSVGELQRANVALKDSMEKLVPSTAQIAGKMNDLSNQAGQTIQLFQQQITAQGALLASQRQWGTDLKGALTNLQEAVLNVVAMAKTINDFTQKQEALVDAIKDERLAQAKISGEVQLSAMHMKSYYEALKECTKKLDQTVTYMDGVARRFASLPPAPTPSPNGR